MENSFKLHTSINGSNDFGGQIISKNENKFDGQVEIMGRPGLYSGMARVQHEGLILKADPGVNVFRNVAELVGES